MHLIFDLDGTLSDSYPGIENGFRYALKKLNHHASAFKDFRDCIGTPLPQTFSEKFCLSSDDTRFAIDSFREYYSEKGWQENELYPGISAMLGELNLKNIPLSVVTNKPTVYAEKILRHFEIRDSFHTVLGQELGHNAVSKSELLGTVVRNNPSYRSTYIGDTVHDVEASRDCGIAAVAVGYGYGDHHEIRMARPEFFVHTVEALKQCLEEIIAR